MLALLALLPLYAFLRGRTGKLSALRFSSADIARAAGGAARSAAGRLLLFLRILALALCILALAGPPFPHCYTGTMAPRGGTHPGPRFFGLTGIPGTWGPHRG